MQQCNQLNEKGHRHGYWIRHYDNGQVWYKGNYVNDNRDGYWEEYYPNGQLWFKGNFINGKKDGYWENYFFDGKLSYKGYFHINNPIKYFKIKDDEYFIINI